MRRLRHLDKLGRLKDVVESMSSFSLALKSSGDPWKYRQPVIEGILVRHRQVKEQGMK